jgi:hypothetical protein
VSLDAIIADDFGQVVELTITDTDSGEFADISSYSDAQVFLLKSPKGSVSGALTAAFSSDGTDGKVKYTLASGDIGQGGNWAIRARVTKSGAQLTSKWTQFQVES